MTTYKEAGVDIEAGDAFVERIKPYATITHRAEVMSGVGGFAGLFALQPGKYKEPVLVSGTDGVGTKLKIAFAANRHDTIGVDLVAMSVNDVLTVGAEPLFFLDYLATSKLDVNQAADVVLGISRGCEEAGCALLGGETAELPGFYTKGEYDLAGFCVGVVERSKILRGTDVAAGDALIGFGSSGLHSNGYSLARKILLEDQKLSLFQRAPGCRRSLGDELLEPTRLYVKQVQALLDAVEVKAMAHITGSGIPGNLPRVMPKNTRAVLEESAWERAPLFDYMAQAGNVSREEMFNTFNMGLGFIAVVRMADVPAALKSQKPFKLPVWEVGRLEPGEGEPTVQIVP